jgi:DNA polymerase-3 subunit epsilon/exodeoxyribonuclease X
MQKSENAAMLIFLDLETTGLEEDAKICSVGLIGVETDGTLHAMYELLNEGKKIPPQASAIHHITNEMVRGKPKLLESEVYAFLQKHNSKTTTIVSHNAPFDLQKLMACGYEFAGETIDTLRLTRALIPECEFFSLQFLRYELKLYKQEPSECLACGMQDGVTPHNALGDALVTKLLYEYLLEDTCHEKMVALLEQKILLHKLPFGKYQGRTIEEIAAYDRGYLEWILSNILDLDEDLRYSIDYHLKG